MNLAFFNQVLVVLVVFAANDAVAGHVNRPGSDTQVANVIGGGTAHTAVQAI